MTITITALQYCLRGGLHVDSTTFLVYVVGHMGSGKGFTAVLNKLLEGMKETSRGIEAALYLGDYALQNFLNLFGRQYDIEYCLTLKNVDQKSTNFHGNNRQ